MRTILFLFAVLFSVAGFGQQQMLLRGAAAGGPVVGILDGYTADAAYCTCWLYSSYSGSLLRVRRASDNAEQDIGRDGQGLDEASLITFCSGTDCFVTTWYDQSGNTRDATQATAPNQPKIYDSVTGVELSNGTASIFFDGVNDGVQSATFSLSSQPVTRLAVSDLAGSPGGAEYIIDGSAGNRGVLGYSGGTAYRIFAGTISDITTTVDLDQNILFALYSGAASELFRNGTSLGVRNIGTHGLDRVVIGDSPGGGQDIQAYISAVVAFGSDQTGNRAAIETALNNYFSIY